VAQGANRIINVSAAQLSHTTFQTGTTADQLSVQVFDGKDWSAWKSFTVTPVQLPITGTSGKDVLVGDARPNHIIGLGGNDTLTGNGGADVLDGGAGTDTASYATSASAVSINLVNGTGQGGDAEGDSLISIERVVGSAFDDQILGSARAETLEGGNGNDIIYGGGGADTVLGGAGNDTISYHDGMRVDGGEGYDTLLADESTVASGIHFKVLGSNFECIGGRGGNDVIDGRGLSDGVTVVGWGGNDTFYGGNGGDVFAGYEGIDTFVEGGKRADYNITQYGGDGNSWLITNKATSELDFDTPVELHCSPTGRERWVRMQWYGLELTGGSRRRPRPSSPRSGSPCQMRSACCWCGWQGKRHSLSSRLCPMRRPSRP
jgi:Ca2+-binding RTX toxin-like protein